MIATWRSVHSCVYFEAPHWQSYHIEVHLLASSLPLIGEWSSLFALCLVPVDRSFQILCLPRLRYRDLSRILSSLLWIDYTLSWWRLLRDGDSYYAGNLHAPFRWLFNNWWRFSRNSCRRQKWWHSCLMNSMVDNKHWGVWWYYTYDCYRNHIRSWPNFEIFNTLPDFDILFLDYNPIIFHITSSTNM